MSDNPGVSLFQGTEELQIETNTRRLEEEEALEDERRREAEIQGVIGAVFSDLEDDDDELKTSDDSSCSGSPNRVDVDSYFEPRFNQKEKRHQFAESRPLTNGGYHMNDLHHIIENSHLYTNVQPSTEQHQGNNHRLENGHCSPETQEQFKKSDDVRVSNNQKYMKDDFTETHLEVLYDIRLKEIDRLRKELDAMHHEADAERMKLLRKATLMEAEKKKAVIARNSAQELLVESKEKIANFEKEIETLRNNLKNTEQSKRELSKELEKSLLTVDDLQRRLKAVESFNKARSDDKQVDNAVKSLKSLHEQELRELQKKYELVCRELESKKSDVSKLQKTVEDVENKFTNMVLEKSEIINQLNQSLERSQSQCQKLITTSMSADSTYVQKLLEQKSRENKELEQKLHTLSSECEILRSDLVTYENSIKYGIVQFDSSKQDKNDSIALLGLESGIHDLSNESNSGIKLDKALTSKLQHEFQRSLASNKVKRNKIQQLESKLRAAEDKIAQLRQEESRYVAQNQGLLENINKLRQHISSREKEWQEKEDRSEKIALYEKELQEKEAEIEKLKNEIKSVRLDLEMKTMELDTQKSKIDYGHIALSNDALVAKISREVSFEKERKIKQLEVELDQLRKELSEVKELYINACSDKESSLKEKQQCLKQISDFASEKRDLTAKLESFTQEKGKLLQRIDELSAAGESLRKQLEPAKLEIESKYKEKIEEIQRNHELALSKTREQVKEQTIRCLTDQIQKLEDGYRARHSKALVEKKKLEVELDEKSKEIEELRSGLKDEKERSELELKNRIEELEGQIDGDREKTAELLSNWMQEVNDMQNETAELKSELDKLRIKYHSLKRAALVYKERASHFEKKSIEDHEKLKKSYELIEQKFKAVIDRKETEIEEKLHLLEKVYREDSVRLPSKSKKSPDVCGDNTVTNDG